MIAQFLALFLAVFAGPAAAASPLNQSGGVAVKGYDVVAYFTEARPVRGSPEFTAQAEGATWRFASAANRDRFRAEPAKYIPQYGGFCAYGVAQGYKVDIDPNAWRIVDGRLYLNYSLSVQKDWEKDIPGYLRRADAKWPELRAK
ncbi:MAG: YHS domain-containing (seleno)protein [Thalassobaculales bacterium]